MLVRTPDRFEECALEMINVISGAWASELHKQHVVNYLVACLKYEYERGYGIGKSDGIKWEPSI